MNRSMPGLHVITNSQSYPNLCSLSWWCHLTISSSVIPFSSCLQSFPTSVQFSSVAQLCPTLCDPMNHRTPGLPVHHQLPESTQTHVHWVGDDIQLSDPPSSPSPPALNLSQHQGLFSIRVFSNESALHIRWPKYWSFSFNISPSNVSGTYVCFKHFSICQ